MPIFELSPTNRNSEIWKGESTNRVVVRAKDEADARILASRWEDRSNHDVVPGVPPEEVDRRWLDRELTTCMQIDPDGSSYVILTGRVPMKSF